MARSRIIKPEFWSDEKLAKISLQARLLYIGLWNTSDDTGTTHGHPLWLKSQIFPYDQISTKQIGRWLQDLVNLGRILPYTVKGEQYYFIPGFLKHQKIQHPSPAKNPAPPREVCDLFTSGSRAAHEQTETEAEAEAEAETEAAPEARSLFKRFWRAYPKKKSKGQAEKVWSAIMPDEQLLDRMLDALRQAERSPGWQKEGGKYIPHPATWRNARGWEDETGPPVAGALPRGCGPVRPLVLEELKGPPRTFTGPEALRLIMERHGVTVQSEENGATIGERGEETHG